jgi:hypothetical protein
VMHEQSPRTVLVLGLTLVGLLLTLRQATAGFSWRQRR